jgi:head-tail adaptor
MPASMVHPRFMTAMKGFFGDTVSIQSNTPTRSASGQQVDAWGNVSGLVTLKCRIAPVSVTETRSAQETYGVFTHTILLQSYQSAITIGQRAVGSDGNTYDIVSVLSNSEHTMTELQTRLVQVTT